MEEARKREPTGERSGSRVPPARARDSCCSDADEVWPSHVPDVVATRVRTANVVHGLALAVAGASGARRTAGTQLAESTNACAA